MVRYNEKTRLTSKALRDFAEALKHSIKLLTDTAETMETLEISALSCRNFASGKSGADAVFKFAAATAEALGPELINRNQTNEDLRVAEEKLEFERSQRKPKKGK